MKGALFRVVTYAIVVTILMLATFFLTNKGSKMFPTYIIAFIMMFGWILLFFPLGTGLVAVPFDLIYGFIQRPQPIKQAEFEVKKKVLLDNLLFLRKRCTETFDLRTKAASQKGFKGWWNMSRLNRRVASIYVKVLVLEKEYIKLVKRSKFAKYVEPMVDYFKLV